MKKFLSLLLVLLMVFSLAACGGSSEKPKTDDDKNKTDASDKFEPETISADKIDPRQVVVDYMYEMANIEWTPSEDIDSTQVHSSLYYTKGVKYHGIMYVTGSRTMTDADEFRAQLNEKGEYIGPPNASKGYGNHCSSALRLAYDLVSEKVDFGYTGEMAPNMNKGMIALGNYKYKDSYKTSYGIFADNPNTDVFVEGYTLLQKGDAILTSWPNPNGNDPSIAQTGHARMIVENHIAKNGAGKVNPHKSYVITIEQTSSFDKQAKEGINTTWYVEHKYTYSDLINTKYIPLTIEAFEAEKEDTTFTTKSLNTEKNFTDGTFKGIVRSSFLPILSVTAEVTDKDGKVVATQVIKNTNKDNKLTFQFKNEEMNDEFKNLAAGSYTYTITANTAYASAKVYKLDLTIN